MPENSLDETQTWWDQILAWLSNNAELIQVLGAIATIVVAIGLNKQIAWLVRTIFYAMTGTKPKLKGNRVFISSPMSDTTDREAFSQVMHEIVLFLEQECKAKVFSGYIKYYDRKAPESYHTQPNATLVKDVDVALKKSQNFILILESKLPTSAYIEIGMALARKKRCVIFYKDDTLPWLLKPDAKLTERGYRVAYYKIHALTDVSALVKKHRDNLFN